MTSPTRIDLARIEERLAERGIPSERIPVGPDAMILVSAYGSRVYGPFFGDGGSESWVPDAFADADQFADLHASGFWNVGGDRIWIGPEIDFMIEDRARYWDSYRMPAAIDPGAHVLARRGDEVTLHRHARLRSHVARPGGHTSIDLSIRVRPAAHPLAMLPAPAWPGGAASVAFGGYTTEVVLAQLADDDVTAESWLLAQVPGGGVALVAGASSMQVTDYYEPVGPLLERGVGGVRVQATGRDRFKIGFAAPHVSGRLGYLREDGDESVLFVRVSPVTPGLGYAEEPDAVPGHRGDALHIYDDDGGLGGFAEMECRGTPVRGSTALPVADRFTTWWFRGAPAAVRGIAEQLLHLPVAPRGAAADPEVSA